MAETKKTKKKKMWIKIIATKEFKNAEIGESYVESPVKLVGRIISVNLMTLTRDAKKQSVNIQFKITEVSGSDKVSTELVGYEMISAHIKRVTKKIKGKVEDSMVAQSNDGIKVCVKPLVTTKVKAHRSDLARLQKAIRIFIKETIEKDSYINLMKSIVSGNLQKEIKQNTKKIFPINLCIIKTAKIVK